MLPSNCRCYLINLDRSPDRLVNMHAHLSALGIAYERIPGVDGMTLDETTFCQHTCKNRYYKPIRRGEVGCYLGHLKALQQFLDSSARYALVLEDDARFEPDICALISDALNLRDHTLDVLLQWDLLKLARPQRRWIALAALGKRQLVEYGLSVPSTQTASIWTRDGAARFVRAFVGVTRPFDCDLQYPWETGLSVLSVHPPAARAEDGPSTMGSAQYSARQPWPKLRYQIERLWPRLRHFGRRYGWSVLLAWLWRRHLVYRGANQ